MTIAVELLQLRLAEARVAYHRLMLGQSAREVLDQNGERIAFTAANAANLRAYISGLEAQIAGNPVSRGPMGVWL